MKLILPNRKILQKICKSIAVLDAIFSQEWDYRYYSYNSKWSENEEFCEIRNGSGDHILILFCEKGCVINGYIHEFKQPNKDILTKKLPAYFEEFIFGEPIKSIGTTFCCWTEETENWHFESKRNETNDLLEMLNIFDGQAQTYINWATDYFEGRYKETGIPFDVVSKIYAGELLTKEMVLSIVKDITDWEQLRLDLIEIDYLCNF